MCARKLTAARVQAIADGTVAGSSAEISQLARELLLYRYCVANSKEPVAYEREVERSIRIVRATGGGEAKECALNALIAAARLGCASSRLVQAMHRETGVSDADPLQAVQRLRKACDTFEWDSAAAAEHVSQLKQQLNEQRERS